MIKQTKLGFSVIESVAAIAFMGVMITIALQVLVLGKTSRTLTQQKVVAQQELSNISQSISSIPYSAINKDWAENLTIDATHQPLLAGAEIEVELSEITAPQQGKKIDLKIHWPDKMRGNYKLTCWKFSPLKQEETP